MSVASGISGLLGRRVHIAGSSSSHTAILLRQYAHDLVARVVQDILHAGGGLVLGIGKEPRAAGDSPNAPSLTFDWTALETAADCLRDGSCLWPTASGPPLVVVSSAKAESEIPENRRSLWNSLLASNVLQLESIQAGARSGAMLRQRQAPFGDILLTLGGGTGVEHLADLYAERRKPVIPLDVPLGASRGDGTGGSERLAQEARASPQKFFLLRSPMVTAANTYLGRIATRHGTEDPILVAKSIVELFMSLTLPTAFYVRLMNDKHTDYLRVETFFRNVVDPIVTEAGFARIDLRVDVTRHAFLNVAIFESLHFSSVVVVDVTGERPNCFIELGYALGCGLRVIVTAEEGTSLPFDQEAIPCHFWTHGVSERDRQTALREFWRKNIGRPPVVR